MSPIFQPTAEPHRASRAESSALRDIGCKKATCKWRKALSRSYYRLKNLMGYERSDLAGGARGFGGSRLARTTCLPCPQSLAAVLVDCGHEAPPLVQVLPTDVLCPGDVGRVRHGLARRAGEVDSGPTQSDLLAGGRPLPSKRRSPIWKRHDVARRHSTASVGAPHAWGAANYGHRRLPIARRPRVQH